MTFDEQPVSELHRIFDLAYEIKDRNQRDQFVSQQCDGDTLLESRLLKLLIAFDHAESIADTPIELAQITTNAKLPIRYDSTSLPSDAKNPKQFQPGDRVGAFVINKELGTGGFGEVFLAEQQEPVKRDVALKLIKPELQSDKVISRFNLERQTLAMMNHDAIAKIFDTGESACGRQYFTMEYVAGLPITEYCNRNQLSIDQRLKLVIKVCNAVHYAHQKGVLHRDIKPANILVIDSGSGPQPKLIDFGIAKSLDLSLADVGQTQDWQFLGTPRYMSPEHATVGSKDLRVGSDVFSLGVVIFELLTDSTPLAQESLEDICLDELFRKIRTCPSDAPSHRLIKTKNCDSATAAKISRQRGTGFGRLLKQLASDLDWVVLKALELDPADRYQSAAALGEDLFRFLNNEPVIARSNTRIYKLGKFVRKHLAAVMTTAIFIFVLAGTTVFSIWQAQIARSAFLSEREQKSNFEELFEVLQSVLKSPSTSFHGENLKVVDLLREKKAEIKNSFPDKPKLRLIMLNMLGRTFSDLEQFEDSKDLLEEALAIASELELKHEEASLSAAYFLAYANFRAGEFIRSTELLEQLLKLEQDPERRVRAMTMYAQNKMFMGNNQKAHEILAAAITLAEEKLEPNHRQVLLVKVALANVEDKNYNFKKALQLRREIFEALPSADEKPSILKLNTTNGLARSYIRLSQPEKALEFASYSSEFLAKKFGKQSPAWLINETLIAISESGCGMLAEAIERLDAAEKIQHSLHPNNVPLALEIGIAKGISYMNAVKSESTSQQANKDLVEASDDLSVQVHSYYGSAVDSFEQAIDLAIRSPGLGEASPYVSATRNRLCEALNGQGKHEKIITIRKRQHEVLNNSNSTHGDRIANAVAIAEEHIQLLMYREAVQWLEAAFDEIVENEKAVLSENGWEIQILDHLILVVSNLNDEPELETLYAEFESRLGDLLSDKEQEQGFERKMVAKQLQFYEARGDQRKVEKARKRLEELDQPVPRAK